MDKEQFNQLIEAIIGIVAITGAGFIVSEHVDNTAIVGLGSGVLMLVLGFYFGQRGSSKAIDGNMAAFERIAEQINKASSQASESTARAMITPSAIVPVVEPAPKILPPNGGQR